MSALRAAEAEVPAAEGLRRKTRLKLPKGKDKGEEKEKANRRKDARLGSFRGVGAQKELAVGSKPPTKAGGAAKAKPQPQPRKRELYTVDVGGRTALVSPVPVDHSKLTFFTWSDAESAQALADAINSWRGEEAVLFGGGGDGTSLVRVKGAEVKPPAKIPPEGYDGWAVKMRLEYLGGDAGAFKHYDPKAGEYVIGDFDPWYGSWRIAKVEGWEGGKPAA